MIQGRHLKNIAIIFRSFALFLVLYQFRLIAGDMADTPVFSASLFTAFAAAVIIYNGMLGKKAPGPIAALIIIGLIPWLARFIIGLPGIIIRPSASASITITLDSLLLNLDRNNFISLLPFYWAAISTWFSLRSQKFLRAAIIADATILLVAYCVVHTADISMYRWPIVMIIIFTVIVFMQALALLFSLPKELMLRRSEIAGGIAALLVLIILSGILFLGPSQQRALEKGGGLLEPKLFSFDFSKFLKLDPEISMSDDLIMIVKKESDYYDEHILLRRSVLSGYSSKQGFYRIDEIDELTHPQRLPVRPTEIQTQAINRKSAGLVRQEYFLVNFDAAAFIGMNQPVSVTPYENWDASSFRSAFMVDSIVCNARPRELLRSTPNWPSREELGLSDSEFKIYTEYGTDERIRALAEKITEGRERYSDKVSMVLNHLKYGDYRYSLKPGIAPDGDQLGWFLFNTKKGYCSYFAFAMTLMLRSLGIPARVTAGFFIDPDTNTFDYYPVRSDMAHAWVEVLYPGYGWMEFDPTTESLAEGEEFNFSAGVDPNLFQRLMREILDNRSKLQIKEGREGATASPVYSLMRTTAALLKMYWYIPLAITLIIINIFLRCKYFILAALQSDKRKKAIRLWKHSQQRLYLAGFRPLSATHESEWAQNADARIPGIYSLYQQAAAARFAPAYTADDFSVMQNNYSGFSAAYRQAVPPLRRLIAWVLPLLALLLPVQGKTSGSRRQNRRGIKGKVIAPLVFLLLVSLGGSDIGAQEVPDSMSDDSLAADLLASDSPPDADTLFDSATSAIYAEHWERAINALKLGGRLYPHDLRFPLALGNLYFDRSLYGLAWDEYKKAEAIDRFDEEILLLLAVTAGLLNESHTSVEYYQRALLINPDNRSTISNLGWMFFKVHRLNEGVKLLTEAIDRFGEEADFAMTLGTLYSVMYNYDESKYWYQRAISLGREVGDMNFTAVAHYNLSILESRFYLYDLSMGETNSSLGARRRASGLLARGELNMRRLELKQSQSDFESAYELDTSPLAKLSLAQIYQISGRLEEARLYAEDCLKAKDHSWMLNFGIDPDRYKKDIHEILFETYEGLAKREAFLPWGRAGEKIRSLFRKISYRYKTAVHRRLYEKYSLAAADSYRAELSSDSPLLDTTLQYYDSFRRYSHRAKLYFYFARDMETELIPASIPSYYVEEGIQFKNTALLEQALAGLNPQWEKILLSYCYREIARLRNSPGQMPAAEELFFLNRGGLIQAGIPLPVNMEVLNDTGMDNFSAMRRGEKKLLRALSKAGFRNANNVSGLIPRYQLRLYIGFPGEDYSGEQYAVLCELTDVHSSSQVFRHILPLKDFSRAAICDFARSLGSRAFKVE